jgi:CheY-like chemotaxis protein
MMQFAVNPERRFRNWEARLEGQALITMQNGDVAYTRAVPADARARKPLLLAIHDDPKALSKVEHELRNRYGSDYRIVCERSAEKGLSKLQKLKETGEEVAVVLANQWMPEMSGVEFLARTREFYPSAKRALLTAWADRTVQESILRAVSLGRIDYYVNKPWGSPDERFHRTIGEFLYDWAKDRLPKFEEIRMVGERWAPGRFARPAGHARAARGGGDTLGGGRRIGGSPAR